MYARTHTFHRERCPCILPILFLILVIIPANQVLGQTTDPFQVLIDRGQRLLAQDDSDGAKTVLIEAVSLKPKSASANYWLAMAYYAQGDNGKAEKYFKETIRRDRTLADAYVGLGRTYMRMKNRMIDARQTMKEALKHNPDNAQVYYYLGLSYLEQSRRDPAAPLYVMQGRHAFQQAAARDTQHPDAYYQLALSFEYPSRDYNRAMSIFYKQLSVNPGHRDALSHLGKCSFLTKQYRVGLDLLNQLKDIHGDALPTYSNVLIAQLEASLLQDEREYEKAAKLYESFIYGLDARERPLYTDLRYVATPQEIADYVSADDATQKEVVRKFWASRDPDPATVVNERLVEHYRRVTHAREYFSRGQQPWDRRGDIYIRYGEPDDLQHFLLRAGESVQAVFRPTGNASIDAIRERNHLMRYRLKVDNGGSPWGNLVNRKMVDPDGDARSDAQSAVPDMAQFFSRAGNETQGLVFVSESWVYVAHDLELFFVDQLGKGKFDYPLGIHETEIEESSIQSRFHPQKMAERLIRTNPESYQFDYGGQPLDYLYDLVTYRGIEGETVLEFAYSVPAWQLGSVSDGQGLKTWFDSHLVLSDHDFNRAANRSTRIGPLERPLTAGKTKALGVDLHTAIVSLKVPPGDYNSAVEVRDEATRRIGIFQQSLHVPDYSATELALSDIRLASSIVPADNVGPFVRNGLHIEPNPARIFQNSEPVSFYYEIYNLKKDVTGQSRYRTELEVSTREQSGNIVWRFLSELGNLIRRSDDRESVSMLFEDEGESSSEFKYTSIDTGDTSSGRYVLTLTVTDLSTDRSTSKSREFVVTNDRQKWYEEQPGKALDIRVIKDKEPEGSP
ncbi:MAG: GWxTD domain-containing protein [Candidatus Latescibacteria bacterium]|nr:GWxTD domain-containing protein [Candidatus Latescibacterota bacterium]